MCSRFCACISSLLNVKTQLDFNPMIMYDQSIIEELPFILLNNSEQIASCIIIDN